MWRGRPMSLILDHINGTANDHRIENLRIVCANCAATLDTHCGRKNRLDVAARACLHCGREFRPKIPSHRYCSQACGVRAKRPYEPRPEARKVPRPSCDQLEVDVASMSFCAVGRKYGVSDNAVRKWLRWYELSARNGAGARKESGALAPSQRHGEHHPPTTDRPQPMQPQVPYQRGAR
jgi:hypothetical protein